MNPPAALRFGTAAASGVALAAAFPSLGWHYLAWFALAPFFWVVLTSRPPAAFLAGLLHGVIFYGLTLPWIQTVMRHHGDLGPVEATGVWLLLLLYLSLFPAFFALALSWFNRAARPARGLIRPVALLLAPALWVTLEFARTRMPVLGFPWNLLGVATEHHLALTQIAAVTGVFGLSLLLAAWNSSLVFVLASAQRGRAWYGLMLLLLLFPWAAHLLDFAVPPAPAGPYLARLVPTGFPQEKAYPRDWFERNAGVMNSLESASLPSATARPELIIWPEVPVPLFSMQHPEFAERVRRFARQSGAHLLTGVVEWRQGRGAAQEWDAFNSAVALAPSGDTVFVYDKIHLVPFGEYVPLRSWLGFADSLTRGISDFRPGTARRLGQLPGGRFAVLICFEAVFPHEVRQFTLAGAGLLVNISNDGWFLGSAAPEQHLSLARLRAVENRRWLLRVTNNGHTVSVDPYGRISHRAPPGGFPGPLDVRFDFRSDRTLYVRWGDWLPWLCVVISLAALLGTSAPFGRFRRDARAAATQGKAES